MSSLPALYRRSSRVDALDGLLMRHTQGDPTEAHPEWSGEPDPEALLASRSSGGFPDPLHDYGRGQGGEVLRHDIIALRGEKTA